MQGQSQVPTVDFLVTIKQCMVGGAELGAWTVDEIHTQANPCALWAQGSCQ